MRSLNEYSWAHISSVCKQHFSTMSAFAFYKAFHVMQCRNRSSFSLFLAYCTTLWVSRMWCTLFDSFKSQLRFPSLTFLLARRKKYKPYIFIHTLILQPFFFFRPSALCVLFRIDPLLCRLARRDRFQYLRHWMVWKSLLFFFIAEKSSWYVCLISSFFLHRT